MASKALQNLKVRLRDAIFPRREPLPRVLCADDDESVRVYCATVLVRAGFMVDEAANGREVLQLLEQGQEYAAVLLDLSMPYLHGATILSLLGRSRPEILSRLIVLTGLSDAALTGMYGSVGAVVRKPIDGDSLLSVVRACAGPRAASLTDTRDVTVRS